MTYLVWGNPARMSTPETFLNCLDVRFRIHYSVLSRIDPMRKVALTSEWDLIQLQDEGGTFSILFNVATYETREVQSTEDIAAVLDA